MHDLLVKINGLEKQLKAFLRLLDLVESNRQSIRVSQVTKVALEQQVL